MQPARGRPRDPRIDERVLEAAVAELAEVGIAGFSTNNVALRAGVDKRGIYSRWPQRARLIVDALSTLAAGLVPPRTGELRADLASLAPDVVAALSGSRREILQRCVAEARRHPDIYSGFRRDSVDRCAAVVEDAFHEARRRGDLAASASAALAAEAFLGMMLARAMLVGDDAAGDARHQHEAIEFCVAAVAAGSVLAD